MCLKSVSKKLIAKRDIIVYKVVLPKQFSSNIYFTSFRLFPIEIPGIYSSNLFLDRDNFVDYGIHSFTNKKDAINFAKRHKEIVVKCFIPKNSHYYKGKFQMYKSLVNSIASNKIVYSEIIKDFVIS